MIYTLIEIINNTVFGNSNMNKHRRKYKFADNQYHYVDMKQYSKIIIDTINKTVPNKHPKVFKDHFSTDPLTQSETVRVGRALSKLEELNSYGKIVITFRLFDGKLYESEESDKQIKNRSNTK